ncbi:MAG TPA: hypothetical protein VMW27_13245 [Thermoanaerobaculia bacterium]|nr:hypothetical protein [Thermoanaerobaculia bacterium]
MRKRQDPRKDADDTAWFRAVIGAMGFGLISIITYSWTQESWSQVLACALLIGLAAALVGALLGFVFGVPKTVARGERVPGDGVSSYEGNTNLEEISDWLTKILVGAGLVELKNIPGALDTFGAQFENKASLGSFGWVTGPAVAISYCVCGFLLAYLWARIYMIRDLDPGELKNIVDAAKNAVIDVDVAKDAADKTVAAAEDAVLGVGEAVSVVNSAEAARAATSAASNSVRETADLAGNVAEAFGGGAAASTATTKVPSDS